MKNPFPAIGKFLLNAIEAPFGKGPWADEYKQAIALAPNALQAIKQVTDATSTKRDDALQGALADLLGTRPTLGMVRDDNSLQGLLKAAARGILTGAFDDIEHVPADHILNLAIEIAFTAFKRGAR